jgi:tRNA threonylcarbamoyladenosine biosynthesis protein TsaB
MLILAVDTTSVSGSIALARDAALLGVVSVLSQEGFSTRMFREVEFLNVELGISLSDIDLYAVNAGPGSFTGLRVGLTAVKAWAEVYRKPIAAVSGLAAVAAQFSVTRGFDGDGAGGGTGDSPGGNRSEYIVPVVDARRGQIYGGVYRRIASGLEACGEDCVMAASEFLREVRDRLASGSVTPVTFVAPDPHLLQSAVAESEFSGCRLEFASSVLAPWIAGLGLAQSHRGELVDALQLEANYIRRPDAEKGVESDAKKDAESGTGTEAGMAGGTGHQPAGGVS